MSNARARPVVLANGEAMVLGLAVDEPQLMKAQWPDQRAIILGATRYQQPAFIKIPADAVLHLGHPGGDTVCTVDPALEIRYDEVHDALHAPGASHLCFLPMQAGKASLESVVRLAQPVDGGAAAAQIRPGAWIVWAVDSNGRTGPGSKVVFSQAASAIPVKFDIDATTPNRVTLQIPPSTAFGPASIVYEHQTQFAYDSRPPVSIPLAETPLAIPVEEFEYGDRLLVHSANAGIVGFYQGESWSRPCKAAAFIRTSELDAKYKLEGIDPQPQQPSFELDSVPADWPNMPSGKAPTMAWLQSEWNLDGTDAVTALVSRHELGPNEEIQMQTDPGEFLYWLLAHEGGYPSDQVRELRQKMTTAPSDPAQFFGLMNSLENFPFDAIAGLFPSNHSMQDQVKALRARVAPDQLSQQNPDDVQREMTRIEQQVVEAFERDIEPHAPPIDGNLEPLAKEPPLEALASLAGCELASELARRRESLPTNGTPDEWPDVSARLAALNHAIQSEPALVDLLTGLKTVGWMDASAAPTNLAAILDEWQATSPEVPIEGPRAHAATEASLAKLAPVLHPQVALERHAASWLSAWVALMTQTPPPLGLIHAPPASGPHVKVIQNLKARLTDVKKHANWSELQSLWLDAETLEQAIAKETESVQSELHRLGSEVVAALNFGPDFVLLDTASRCTAAQTGASRLAEEMKETERALSNLPPFAPHMDLREKLMDCKELADALESAESIAAISPHAKALAAWLQTRQSLCDALDHESHGPESLRTELIRQATNETARQLFGADEFWALACRLPVASCEPDLVAAASWMESLRRGENSNEPSAQLGALQSRIERGESPWGNLKAAIQKAAHGLKKPAIATGLPFPSLAIVRDTAAILAWLDEVASQVASEKLPATTLAFLHEHQLAPEPTT